MNSSALSSSGVPGWMQLEAGEAGVNEINFQASKNFLTEHFFDLYSLDNDSI